MRDIDDFLPSVLTLVPDCPDPLAFRFLREAGGELCEATKSWTETDTLTVTSTLGHAVTTIADAHIVEIRNARLDGRPLEPKPVAWLDEHFPDWQDGAVTGGARFVTQTAPDTVSIVPPTGGTLKVRLVLKPSPEALELPDFLFDHHQQMLARGAAGYLLTLPRTGFENPQLGSAYLNAFKSDLSRVGRKALRTQTGAPVRTKPRWF